MNQAEFTNILLCIMSFIGVLSVKQLIKMAQSINEINISVKSQSIEHNHLKEGHDELKVRVSKVEKKIFDCE